MTGIGNLSLPFSQWTAVGLPITMLMNMELRKGKLKPVIQKALVELSGKPFSRFKKERRECIDDLYEYPGPIQFFGDKGLTDAPPKSIEIEAHA
jgi:diphosphate-dependent phosphofructokinase